MNARITHVGTATVVLDLAGTSIVTDPVLDPAGSRYPLARGRLSDAFAYVNLAGAAIEALPTEPDLVLLSHDHHRDNLDRAGLELLRRATRVLTTRSGAARLAARGVRHVEGLSPWQRVTHGELSITATPARHGPIGTNWLAGDVVGFAIDGPMLRWGTLYVTGDTHWFAGTAAMLGRFPRLRTILAHVGAARFGHFALRRWLRFSMDAREARIMADHLAPRQIIPIHYDGRSHFSEGRDALERVFADADPAAGLRFLPRGASEPLEPEQGERA